MIKGLKLYGLLLAAVAAGVLVSGCGSNDTGPDNATMIKNMNLPKNTDPNAPGAVQPRDLMGNPISVGSSKNGAGKLGDTSTGPAGAPSGNSKGPDNAVH